MSCQECSVTDTRIMRKLGHQALGMQAGVWCLDVQAHSLLHSGAHKGAGGDKFPLARG